MWSKDMKNIWTFYVFLKGPSLTHHFRMFRNSVSKLTKKRLQICNFPILFRARLNHTTSAWTPIPILSPEKLWDNESTFWCLDSAYFITINAANIKFRGEAEVLMSSYFSRRCEFNKFCLWDDQQIDNQSRWIWISLLTQADKVLNFH